MNLYAARRLLWNRPEDSFSAIGHQDSAVGKERKNCNRHVSMLLRCFVVAEISSLHCARFLLLCVVADGLYNKGEIVRLVKRSCPTVVPLENRHVDSGVDRHLTR